MKTAASGTPWHLGGWSTGATMAFEVARLLRHEGTPAASLSLFDAFRPYRPALLNHDPDAAVARVMQTIGRNLAVYHGIEPMPDTPRERETEEETIERYLVDVRDRALVPADFDDTMVKSFLLASERNVRAVWAYEPVVGSERTALFRASEAFAWPIDEEGELAKDDALGWRALLSGPLTVVPVQGNHVSMFQVGQVEGLANALAAFVRGEGQFA
jgi:thioesterase domain-containing protein